jgi:ribosomal protein S18 acetylase RimI-like enzyme
MTVTYSVNVASVGELGEHLRRCDDGYVPKLSERVAIDDYARKIADRAVRFEAWIGDRLVGLVAAYLPTAKGGPLFITDVSVDPEQRGRHVASALLDECAAFARRHSVARVRLEVDRRNRPAMRLYAANAFTEVARGGETVTMERLVEAGVAG